MSTPLNLQPNHRVAALTLMHPVKPGRADLLRDELQHLSDEDIAAIQGKSVSILRASVSRGSRKGPGERRPLIP